MGQFHPGLDESPEELRQLLSFKWAACPSAVGRRLTGPGIEKEHFLEVDGPSGRILGGRGRANHSLYPLGVDLILTAGQELAALPRTTRVE